MGTAAFGEPASASTSDPAAAEISGYRRGLGAASSASLGAALSRRLADEYLPAETEDEEKTGGFLYRGLKKKAWSENQPGGMYGNTKAVGTLGAGLGGALGGVYGAVHPGETKDKKQRSRLMGALRGLAAGGAIGGGVGAGAGLGLDAIYEPKIEVFPGVGVNVDTIDAGIKKLEENAQRIGDAAKPYAKQIGDGVKKVDETVTPWLDWFNGKKKQQP